MLAWDRNLVLETKEQQNIYDSLYVFYIKILLNIAFRILLFVIQFSHAADGSFLSMFSISSITVKVEEILWLLLFYS